MIYKTRVFSLLLVGFFFFFMIAVVLLSVLFEENIQFFAKIFVLVVLTSFLLAWAAFFVLLLFLKFEIKNEGMFLFLFGRRAFVGFQEIKFISNNFILIKKYL